MTTLTSMKDDRIPRRSACEYRCARAHRHVQTSSVSGGDSQMRRHREKESDMLSFVAPDSQGQMKMLNDLA